MHLLRFTKAIYKDNITIEITSYLPPHILKAGLICKHCVYA